MSFFGGEPLIGIKEIKNFLDYLYLEKREWVKNIELGISTNALLLNEETIKFFVKYNVKVGLSIDGPDYIDDKLRVIQTEEGSYGVHKIVMKKINMLKNNEVPFSIQMTLNKNHIKHYKKGRAIEWLRELEELNPEQIAVVTVSTEDTSIQISNDDIEILNQIIVELVRYNYEKLKNNEDVKGISFINPIFQIVQRMVQKECGAGRSVFIDTDGKIYPCHMFCNDDEYLLGDINEKTFNKYKGAKHSDTSKKNSIKCSDCIAKNLCSVWCPGLNYLMNQSLLNPEEIRCAFMKTIVEENIKILYELSLEKNLAKKLWSNYGKQIK